LDTQGAYAVAIGFSSGNATQGTGAIAIGKNAGLTAQGANAVAIGINAAQGAQPGVNYVSGGVSSTTLVVDDTTFLTPGMVVTGGIGWTSNQYIVSITNPTTLVMSAVADSTPTGTIFFTAKQSDNAIAIGFEAGKNSQGSNTFAAGTNAGGINQGNFAVALGESSGTVSQGIAAIAIGSGAGTNNQGATAIAIGSGAGDTNQPAHSIIINASGSILDGTNAGLYIDPVRNDTVSTTNAVYYNTTSKELTYGPASSGGSPASPSTSVQFNNAGAFGGSADFTWDGTTLKALNVQATNGGVYAASTFTGTFTDGIVIDHVTGTAPISAGAADDITFYNGGVAGSELGRASSNGNWTLNGNVVVGNGTPIGGLSNPLISANGSANSYVEVYSHNDNTGTSASADFVAYPDNGADATGWVDLGINSSTFSDAAYSITTPNEGYLLMSNPSTATTATGNLVFATDSTGTTNAYQWYVGGFTQAKTAYKMQLDGTLLYVKQAVKADGVVESTTGGFKFPDATTQTTSAYPASTAANQVLASPNGSAGTPSYRALVSNDIPDLLLTKLPEAWVKMSVNAATTANITLSGTQTIDGVALIAGNRCLVKNQTAAQDNGIYDVSAGAWARSADANTISKIAGAAVNVDAGTVNGGKIYDTDLKTTDTLGVTAMNWYSLVDINGATFVGTLTLRAGTATAGTAPLYMTSGTSLTTAAAGALEYDGNTPYFSIAASTRGVLPTEQIVVLTGTNTLTSQTGVQPIFDGGGGPVNGSVTLPIGTYQFECSFAANTLSATSGSFGFALGGAATKTYTYQAMASKATSLTAPAAANSGAVYSSFQTGAATTLVAANTNTVCTGFMKGTIRVTVAGTVIPQISLGVASAAVIQAGSYFKVSPLGNVSTVATVGNWA